MKLTHLALITAWLMFVIFMFGVGSSCKGMILEYGCSRNCPQAFDIKHDKREAILKGEQVSSCNCSDVSGSTIMSFDCAGCCD